MEHIHNNCSYQLMRARSRERTYSNMEGLRFIDFAGISTNSDLSVEHGYVRHCRLNFCGLSIV